MGGCPPNCCSESPSVTGLNFSFSFCACSRPPNRVTGHCHDYLRHAIPADVYHIFSASTGLCLFHAPLRSFTMQSFTFFTLTFLHFSMFALAAPRGRPASDASQYNDPNNGTPVSLFTASPSLQNQSSSLTAAAKAASEILESYPLNSPQPSKSNIYGDWSGFNHVN